MIVRSDWEIQAAVLDELAWDSRVTTTDIGVTVHQSIVTLSGVVHSYAERMAAEAAAHRLHGVLDVVNGVEVQIPGMGLPADTEIAQAAHRALVRDLQAPEDRIQTTVSDRWVRLDGEVDRWSQREEAEQAVGHLRGVRGVTNAIRVNAPPVSPPELRHAIEQALERHADRTAGQIRITVNDGTVILTGTVHSWLQRRAVVETVGQSLGVQAVDDRLEIDPRNYNPAAIIL
jgi:osmotically-inducible protein OsmY